MSAPPRRVLARVLAACLACGAAAAQAPFRVEARGPFRAGEWVALALDAASVRDVQEIAVHPEGRANAWVSFRRGPERSEPPARFPLCLDERGRFEVRCDGRVVQRLALEMQRGSTWPARTWLAPQTSAPARPAWWELAAYSAAYAPEGASAPSQEIAARIARARRLPNEPFEVDALRAAQLLREPQRGHALGLGLLALVVATLALERRRRAALWLAGGAGAIALQLAAPSALWSGVDRVVVWSAAPSAAGNWELCADELRFGDGEVALDPELWLAPLAGGELVDCRAQSGGWVVRYRGGLVRRWFAPPGALGMAPELAAGAGLRFYLGRRYRGRAHAAALLDGGVPPELREGSARERADLLASLAGIYAASGERQHSLWTSAAARAAARRFQRWWPWLRASSAALLRGARAGDGEPEPPGVRPTWAAWEELLATPADPFGAPEAARFLRLCEGG